MRPSSLCSRHELKQLGSQSAPLQAQRVRALNSATKLALVPFRHNFASDYRSHNGNIVKTFVIMKGFSKAAPELHSSRL